MNVKERFSEEDFTDFLGELIETHRIEDTALGIAKKVIDKGLDSLSDKQMFVLEKYVVTPNYLDECVRGCEIPWCEMVFALDNGGMCSYCHHVTTKDD